MERLIKRYNSVISNELKEFIDGTGYWTSNNYEKWMKICYKIDSDTKKELLYVSYFRNESIVLLVVADEFETEIKYPTFDFLCLSVYDKKGIAIYQRMKINKY